MITIEQSTYDEGIRAIRSLSQALPPKELRKILTKGSKIYSNAAKQAAPVSTKEHHRYSTAKLSGKLKAPKGMGNIVATYKPGNLKRSIRKLAARRLMRAVMIGPKKAKGNTKGVFSGNRTDGYYANMIEGGTKHIEANPFLEPAWIKTRGQVVAQITRDISDVIIAKALQS